MLTNLIVVNISKYICVSTHCIVHLKFTQCYMSIASLYLKKTTMCSLSYLSKRVGVTIFLVHNEIFLPHSISSIHCIYIPQRILLCSLLVIHQQQPHLLQQVEAYNSHYFLRKVVILKLI